MEEIGCDFRESGAYCPKSILESFIAVLGGCKNWVLTVPSGLADTTGMCPDLQRGVRQREWQGWGRRREVLPDQGCVLDSRSGRETRVPGGWASVSSPRR